MNIISVLKYVFLGIIQGFTEPIPISSSSHLLILKKLLNVSLNDLNFEIIVNFGSFIAIFFLYRNEIFKIIKDFIAYIKSRNKECKNNYKYGLLIIIATIPAGILGLIFKDKIDLLSNNIKLIGIALLITSCALFLIKDESGYKQKDSISYQDGLIVGLFQAIALLPGISRSGSTIVGGMLCNLKKEVAVNFSFMLYLPISVATLILGVKDLINTPNIGSLVLPYTLGMIFSAIVTYFSAKWFINIMKKGKLIYFSIYCLIVGILVVLFL